MTKYPFFLVLAIVILPFASLVAQAEIPVDSNRFVEKQVFSFEEEGLSIQVFENWFIQDSLSHQGLMGKSKQIIAGDNEKLLQKLDNGEEKVHYLLTAFKYPLEDKRVYNPSLTVVSEDMSSMSEPLDAEQYLTAQKQLLNQSQAGFRVRDGFQLKRLSGQRFYSMHSLIKYGGVYIRQVHYTTIHRGRALSLILSFVKDEDQIELEDMVRTVLVR